jgi:RimJ/RimL family protein N-acetyltransferase
MDNSDNMFLAICDKQTGLHIGNATVNMDMHNGIADVSIMVGDRGFWGKGLGGEAFTALVDYLLHRTNVRKVTAGTMAANKPMLKAMALARMAEEARRSNHYLLNGNPVDIVYFSRWRNDG